MKKYYVLLRFAKKITFLNDSSIIMNVFKKKFIQSRTLVFDVELMKIY